MNQISFLHKTSKVLRKLRHDRDLNQKQVAAGIPMDYSVYNRFESGLTSLHVAQAIQIAKFYEISGGQLVDMIEKAKV